MDAKEQKQDVGCQHDCEQNYVQMQQGLVDAELNQSVSVDEVNSAGDWYPPEWLQVLEEMKQVPNLKHR